MRLSFFAGTASSEECERGEEGEDSSGESHRGILEDMGEENADCHEVADIEDDTHFQALVDGNRESEERPTLRLSDECVDLIGLEWGFPEGYSEGFFHSFS